MLKKDEKNRETKEIISAYQKERDDHKKFLALQSKAEEDKINQYNKMMRQRIEQQEIQQKIAEEEKKKAWHQVAEETQNFNQSRDDYTALRDMLWEEERYEREKKEEEDARLRRLKLKEQLLNENKEQIQAKKETLATLEEEERQMVKKMLDKFADDEEDERAKQIASLEAKKQFMEEARHQRQEKERMFKEERERQQEDLCKETEREEYKRKVIEEARKRLLEKHASQLKGFLPKVSSNTIEISIYRIFNYSDFV